MFFDKFTGKPNVEGLGYAFLFRNVTVSFYGTREDTYVGATQYTFTFIGHDINDPPLGLYYDAKNTDSQTVACKRKE